MEDLVFLHHPWPSGLPILQLSQERHAEYYGNQATQKMLRKRKSSASRPPGHPGSYLVVGCGLNPCRWQPAPQKKTTFFFSFSPALSCNWIRAETPRPHQERRALGRGRRRGCGRREGPKERAERASNSVRRLSRRKIKKNGKEKSKQTFSGAIPSPPSRLRSRNPHSVPLEDKGAPRERRRDPRAWAPPRSPHRPAPRHRGPCLPPLDPPAASCSPCSRSARRSPPSAGPKAATSAPK